MKARVLFLIVVFLFSGCVTYNLERKLPKDIKDWYYLHSPLMETKVPEWIKEGNGSEASMFLHFPEEWQRKYMRIFWELRLEDSRELFYSRIEYANAMFRNEGKPGWMTDRGRIFIICGEPTFVQYYHKGVPTIESEMIDSLDYIQVWVYLWGAERAIFTFRCYPPSSWVSDYSGLYDYGEAEWFKRWCLKTFFAPTEEGWMRLASYLIIWQKEGE